MKRHAPGVDNMPPSILLFAESNWNGDQRHFTGFVAGDRYLAFSHRGKKRVIVGALEYGRALKEAKVDGVLSLEALQVLARRMFPGTQPGTAEVIAALAGRFGIRDFTVPADFPVGIARRVQWLGVNVHVGPERFFPARLIKSAAAAHAIRRANDCAAAAFTRVASILARALIVRRRLVFQGATLTSEYLQRVIEVECVQRGTTLIATTVAGGRQACDPHCRGHGPLRPNELIIVDIFPREKSTGYFGDMTRTFLKGSPSDAQRRLVATVREAQAAAIAVIRPGVQARTVHRQADGVFARTGYVTEFADDGSRGFIHGTGHGLGLELHEAPRLNATTRLALRRGMVMTVEPGLYYPEIGGCRIEDVIQVTRSGCRRLSSFPYHWHIP